ncbi:uncharacterized protein LOC122648827 isoform X6 [Telopea speciosissima]|uniref:uncharacterized protein LOC122648827 isoform X6 n=1 Tax=Telopea speciosissima TaxID=54955 RepID=UPI001CC51AB0|nr:uncharacterized protein LOC122648827 isoform X6 [Telopea speciosissima]
MSSGSTNEASSEILDLNSEAVPLVEEEVSVVRVAESTVAITLSVDENLVEQALDTQSPAQGTNPEGETAEAGVSGEGRNLLETFAQGSDVCDGSTGAHGVRGSSEEEESADVCLIKESSERVTKKSVDAGGDGKFGGQPDVALTLKLGASDTEGLTDRVEVTEAESSMTITELTFEEIHVASGERAVELENSEVLNSKGDVPEPMDLDEKPYFPEKNQGVEVEGVGGGTEANDVRDTDPSVSLSSPSNCVHNTTLNIGNSDVNPSQDGIQELVAQIAKTPSDQVIRDQSMDLHLTEANADEGAAVTVDTNLATEAIDESKDAVLDKNQEADVQIAGACGYHQGDQRMGSPSPELGASPLVDNQSMGFDVEAIAVGGCNKLDENLTQSQSQSQPIASDSDAVNSVVDLGSCHSTDFEKKVVEEVLNEDERMEVKEIEADATHPGADENLKTVREVLKEDGGIAAKEMGDDVSNPGTDGNQKTVDEVFEEEEGSRVKEMLDDVNCRDRDGDQNTADEVFKDDEGTGVKEIADDVTHLDKDVDKMTADKVDWEAEGTKVREVGDGVTCLGTDGNLKAVDEIFRKDEGTEVKDGNQMILDDALREGEETEAKEIGTDVTHPSSDGDQRNVGEVVKEDEGPRVKEREDDAKCSVSDCLDENLTKNVSRVDSHVNQMLETSEQVTTTLNPGTASVNDNRVFYGLPTEEGDFSVSDLVWGKVKSHPWWPGQIFDPSDASEQAMKYRKKDSLLVAYFGDRTFAWNEASLLKPFRANFSQMEKQTNLESFRKAVDCALDEIARRVELGLACSCTFEEVYAKTGSQMIENPGIREESSRRKGMDESISVSSFEPEMLVEYIRELALFPYGGVDRLELVIAQVQLLAVHRSRGYSCLPTFQLCGSLVENEADSLILAESKHSKAIVDDSAAISENKDQVLSGKVKFKSRDGSFRKRKHTSEDGGHPIKKERSLSELMAGKKVFSSDDGNESVDGKPVSSLLGKKRKAGDSIPDDSVIQNRKRSISLSGAADADSAQPKRSFKVGESICRVASQLTGSSPILKCSGERLRKVAVKVDQNRESSTWDGDAASPRTPEQRRKIVLPTEHSSPEEMLSQLCLAARDPIKGYSFLTTIISFFSEFRNFVCLDHASSWKHKMSSEKVGGKKKKPPNSNMDSTESYSFEDMQDSYWTDRIVQIGPEEQPLDKSQKKRGRPRKKIFMLTNGADDSHQCSPALDIEQQNPYHNAEQPVEISVGSLDANSKDPNSPAALILSFPESDADSIPSEKNLNIIFRHFGPLKESETEVLKTTNCARVVFKRHTDAEVALSSAGKFSIFGPVHVSYRLMYWPPTSAKAPSFAATQLIEYVAPQGIEDVESQGIEDMAPQLIVDVAPQGIEDMAPQSIENGESQGIEDMDMAPLLVEDVAPQGIVDMAPQGIEDVESQGIEDMAPQGIEDVESQGIEDMAPQGVEDMESKGIDDMAPQGIEDMASRGIEDVAPQGIEDGASEGIEDMVPAGGNEDMAPQGIEDMAPVRGSTS